MSNKGLTSYHKLEANNGNVQLSGRWTEGSTRWGRSYDSVALHI